VALALLLLPVVAQAQAAGETGGTALPPATQVAPPPGVSTVVCQSQGTDREHCAADTSAGVVFVRSTGTAPCLLGKTWGYDDTGIWVSEGCSGEFIAGRQVGSQVTRVKPLEHIPNAGFLLYSGEEGEIYFRLFSYVRYLNQRNIDSSYTDASGVEHTVRLPRAVRDRRSHRRR